MTSQYWLNRRNNLTNQKNRIKAVVSKLETINNKINGVPEVLDESEQYFRNGGYNDGDTLDRGVLRGCSSDLEIALTTISSTITTGNDKIIKLDDEIETCNTNYLKCLEEENKNK